MLKRAFPTRSWVQVLLLFQLATVFCHRSLPEMSAGVTLLPLRDALEKFGDRLQPMLVAVELEGAGRMFSALNTAFLDQGLVVHVDKNTQAGKLLVRWAFSGGESIRLGNFRLVILLEKGAKLDLIEQFESAGAASGALNVLTQIDLADEAQLSHVRIQDEGDDVVLLTSTSVQQAAASIYQYSGFDLGGGLVRHELHSELAGAGALRRFRRRFRAGPETTRRQPHQCRPCSARLQQQASSSGACWAAAVAAFSMAVR